MNRSFDDEAWRTDEDDDAEEFVSESAEEEDDESSIEASGDEEESESDEEGFESGDEDDSRGEYSDEDAEGGEAFLDEEDQEDAEQYPLQREPADDEKEAKPKCSRRGFLACTLCGICLIVVGAAIALGLVMSEGQGTTVAPTFAPAALTPPPVKAAASTPTFVFPTFAPNYVAPTITTPAPTNSSAPTASISTSPTQSPTSRPTSSPSTSMAPTRAVPDVLSLVPDQDTYIYTDGFYEADSFGHDQTLLVQHGPRGVPEVPTAYILMTFNLDLVPAAWRIANRNNTAVLKLTHAIRPDAAKQNASTYTVVRLPATPLAVETLHGLLFVPYSGINGSNFTVSPFQQQVEVDITSLLFGLPPYNISRRYGRNLQEPTKNQFFIMIQDQGPSQPIGGDRFYSRESNNPPELVLRFQKIPGAPPTRLSPTPSPITPPSNPVPTFVTPGQWPPSVPSPTVLPLRN